MNETLKSILEILEDSKPELQIAAVQVLGELRPKDAAVTSSLATLLHRGEDYLSRHVLVAMSQIATGPALAQLVKCLLEGPPSADLAAHLLGDVGEAAVEPLTEAFADADNAGRERILALLNRLGSVEALPVMEEALFISPLCHLAAEGMQASTLEQLDGRRLRALKTRMSKALDDEGIEDHVLAQVLRVLGSLGAEDSRTTLLKFSKNDHGAEVRQAALESLVGVSLTPAQSEALLEYLTEDNLEQVVEPSMVLLADVSNWRASAQQVLRKLLSSRREHLRLFALKSMKGIKSAELVKPLVNHLLGPSEEMASAAAEALSENPAALEPMLRSFQLEKNPEKAKHLSIPLTKLGEKLSDAQIKSLGEKGCKQLIAQDPMGEVLLDLLMRAQPVKGPAFAVDKSQRMRRARKLPECLAILVFLAQGEYLDDEGSYQLAVARLLLDDQTTREPGQVGDATMGYFARLVREEFPLLDRLKKESMVTPEALLRIGSHFADGVSSERRFGAEVLQYVSEKHSRHRAGEEALTMLKTGGLI
ncbi:MAG: HEAT repeat domain-containing protein [Planctomycetota bacterium]|jgi:HEAT repeat protein